MECTSACCLCFILLIAGIVLFAVAFEMWQKAWGHGHEMQDYIWVNQTKKLPLEKSDRTSGKSGLLGSFLDEGQNNRAFNENQAVVEPNAEFGTSVLQEDNFERGAPADLLANVVLEAHPLWGDSAAALLFNSGGASQTTRWGPPSASADSPLRDDAPAAYSFLEHRHVGHEREHFDYDSEGCDCEDTTSDWSSAWGSDWSRAGRAEVWLETAPVSGGEVSGGAVRRGEMREGIKPGLLVWEEMAEELVDDPS